MRARPPPGPERRAVGLDGVEDRVRDDVVTGGEGQPELPGHLRADPGPGAEHEHLDVGALSRQHVQRLPVRAPGGALEEGQHVDDLGAADRPQLAAGSLTRALRIRRPTIPCRGENR